MSETPESTQPELEKVSGGTQDGKQADLYGESESGKVVRPTDAGGRVPVVDLIQTENPPQTSAVEVRTTSTQPKEALTSTGVPAGPQLSKDISSVGTTQPKEVLTSTGVPAGPQLSKDISSVSTTQPKEVLSTGVPAGPQVFKDMSSFGAAQPKEVSSSYVVPNLEKVSTNNPLQPVKQSADSDLGGTGTGSGIRNEIKSSFTAQGVRSIEPVVEGKVMAPVNGALEKQPPIVATENLNMERTESRFDFGSKGLPAAKETYSIVPPNNKDMYSNPYAETTLREGKTPPNVVPNTITSFKESGKEYSDVTSKISRTTETYSSDDIRSALKAKEAQYGTGYDTPVSSFKTKPEYQLNSEKPYYSETAPKVESVKYEAAKYFASTEGEKLKYQDTTAMASSTMQRTFTEGGYKYEKEMVAYGTSTSDRTGKIISGGEYDTRATYNPSVPNKLEYGSLSTKIDYASLNTSAGPALDRRFSEMGPNERFAPSTAYDPKLDKINAAMAAYSAPADGRMNFEGKVPIESRTAYDRVAYDRAAFEGKIPAEGKIPYDGKLPPSGETRNALPADQNRAFDTAALARTGATPGELRGIEPGARPGDIPRTGEPSRTPIDQLAATGPKIEQQTQPTSTNRVEPTSFASTNTVPPRSEAASPSPAAVPADHSVASRSALPTEQVRVSETSSKPITAPEQTNYTRAVDTLAATPRPDYVPVSPTVPRAETGALPAAASITGPSTFARASVEDGAARTMPVDARAMPLDSSMLTGKVAADGRSSGVPFIDPRTGLLVEGRVLDVRGAVLPVDVRSAVADARTGAALPLDGKAMPMADGRIVPSSGDVRSGMLPTDGRGSALTGTGAIDGRVPGGISADGARGVPLTGADGRAGRAEPGAGRLDAVPGRPDGPLVGGVRGGAELIGIAGRGDQIGGGRTGAGDDVRGANDRTPGHTSVRVDADGVVRIVPGITGAVDGATRTVRDPITGDLIEDGEEIVEGEDGEIVIRKVKGEKRYVLGVELAIAGLLTAAAVARHRSDGEEILNGNIDPNSAMSDLQYVDGDQQDPNAQEVQVQSIMARRSYLISPGDTFQSIAEQFYRDSSLGWLIADLNAGAIKESLLDGKRVLEVAARQVIELPDFRDIQTFRLNKPKDLDVDAIVTIVTENSVDKELLQSYLGRVTGDATKPAKAATATQSNPADAAQIAAKITQPKRLAALLKGIPDTVAALNRSRKTSPDSAQS